MSPVIPIEETGERIRGREALAVARAAELDIAERMLWLINREAEMELSNRKENEGEDNGRRNPI